MMKRKAFKKNRNRGSDEAVDRDVSMTDESAVEADRSTTKNALYGAQYLIDTGVSSGSPSKPSGSPFNYMGGDEPRTADMTPLSFLPLLPEGLHLVESYQQVMSPSFSRWLCVVEKREVIVGVDPVGEEGQVD